MDNWRCQAERTIELLRTGVGDLPDGVAVQHGVLERTEGDRARTNRPRRGRLADHARGSSTRSTNLERHGQEASSASTVVKNKGDDEVRVPRAPARADMFGTGVLRPCGGVHIQNLDTREAYVEKLDKGEPPLGRAFLTTERRPPDPRGRTAAEDRLADAELLDRSTQVDIRDEFRSAFAKLQDDGRVVLNGDAIETTRDGLMQIDRHLPAFDPQHISTCCYASA
ncbi:MAG: hypothetical protein U0791_16190 [Gemmataceae bacterium]